MSKEKFCNKSAEHDRNIKYISSELSKLEGPKEIEEHKYHLMKMRLEFIQKNWEQKELNFQI
jgi:hypothetical protein